MIVIKLIIIWTDEEITIPEDLEKPIADALFAVLSQRGSEDEDKRRREEEMEEQRITEVALMESLQLRQPGERMLVDEFESSESGSSSGSSQFTTMSSESSKHEWLDMEKMVDGLVDGDEVKGKGKAKQHDEDSHQKNNRDGNNNGRGRVIRTPAERREEEMSVREEEWSCQYCESLNEGEKGDKSAECNLCGVLRGSLGSIVSDSLLPPEGGEGTYPSAAPTPSLQQSQEFLHASFFKLMFPMFRQEDLEQVIRGSLGFLVPVDISYL